MSDVRKNLMQAVERLPAFPKSVHQVITMSADINCSQKELVEVVKRDPVLTLKILKLVNSPYFGLVKEVTSINQASVYLGLNTLKNVALGLAVVGAFPSKKMPGFTPEEFWLHSLSVAAISKTMGERVIVGRESDSDHFVAGLLHDVGKLVFALYMPELFQQALELAHTDAMPLHVAEKEVIGADHAEVGALLTEKWNLSKTLIKAISGHHSDEIGKLEWATQCVFVADQISKKMNYGFAGESLIDTFPESLLDALSTDIDGLIASMPDLGEEVDRARAFIQLGDSI